MAADTSPAQSKRGERLNRNKGMVRMGRIYSNSKDSASGKDSSPHECASGDESTSSAES